MGRIIAREFHTELVLSGKTTISVEPLVTARQLSTETDGRVVGILASYSVASQKQEKIALWTGVEGNGSIQT